MTSTAIISTLKQMDWEQAEKDLDAQGFAVLKGMFTPTQCRSITALYKTEEYFRKKVIMENHGYGRGEYKYFAYPLPEIVQNLRASIYPKLAPIANRWHEAMKIARRYPPEHSEYLAVCHEAGQLRPTPLMLQYGPGDFNCLHQDLYGEHVFPMQLAVLLSAPQIDFTGGEFIITEQRPHMQTKPSVVPLLQGGAVIFAVHYRPVRGSRGIYRVNLRHGVSQLLSGRRNTLGVIFHEAQ